MSQKPVPSVCASSTIVARWEETALKVLVILLAGWFVYAPVLRGQWIIDDFLEVFGNAVVQGGAGSLAKIWHGEAGPDYLPLKTTLLWALWQVFGNNPPAFHLADIALHLTSALLLWRVFWRLGMRHAWLGGLLFAVHPVLVGSAAWIAEIKNTLSLTVLLAAILVWLRFDGRGREPGAYFISLVLFGAALLCKASVVMWPVVMLLYIWWQRGRITWKDLAASVPFFLFSLAAGIATLWRQDRAEIGFDVFPVGGLSSRLDLTGLNLAFYFWKLAWPAHLLPMYPRWRVQPPGPGGLLAWLILGGVGCWLWTRRGTGWGRASLFGLGFFVVNLLPVLGFVNMTYMRITWAADHLVYLPAVGIIGLAAAGAGRIYDALRESKRPWALSVGILSLAALGGAAYQHAEVYQDMATMCLYTMRYNPEAWAAHLLYSSCLLDQGDLDGAAAQASSAARLNPANPDIDSILANVLEKKGQPAEAIGPLREAIRLAPRSLVYHANLARCLAKTQQFGEALREYTMLLGTAPGSKIFHCNRGACLYGLNRIDEAIAEFQAALAIDPGYEDAQKNLAGALRAREGASGAP